MVYPLEDIVSMAIHCQFCSYRCTNYRSYIKHVFESHSSVPNFLFTCGINGCSRTFRNYSSIKSHFSRHHGDELESNVDHLSTNDLGDEMTTAEPDALDLVQPESPEITVLSSSPRNGSSDERPYLDHLQRSCALYLLTLKEKYKLTQTAVDFVVGQTKDTIQNIIDRLHQSVREQISGEDQSNLDSIFESASNPFSGLETQYLQSKYFEKNLGLVVCIYINGILLFIQYKYM